MSRNHTKKDVSTKTRRAIIDLLKQQGGMDVMALSSQFSLSGMAIRQHLNALKEEGLVTNKEESRPMGRPTKLWILTPAADRFFPSGYSDLSVSLINSMKEAFGNEGWTSCWLFEIRICKNNIFSILVIQQTLERNWRSWPRFEQMKVIWPRLRSRKMAVFYSLRNIARSVKLLLCVPGYVRMSCIYLKLF